MPASAPYLYAAPARYSSHDPYGGFDPKAVSRASLAPKPQRPKQNGPLIEFNKHPDSYLIKPYGQTSTEPMPKHTKRNVKIARKTQAVLRTFGLIGCLGTLVGTVLVKNTQDIETYVIRIPPAFDILFTIYAIYHLVRSARARTPASSTSYHFFACFIDIAIIPFYVYITLAGRRRLAQPATDENRWVSLISQPNATDIILKEIWLASITSAGIHALNFVLSMFLVVMFYRISNQPPDMNPLEDNLTSRRKSTKHKYKNSEASAVSSFEHNGSLLSSNDSTAKLPDTNVRPVSFLQTRNMASTGVYNPHNPLTAEASRSSFFAPPKLSDTSRPGSSKADSSLLGVPAVPRKSSKRTSDGNWMVIEGSDDGSVLAHSDKEPSLPNIEALSAMPGRKSYQPLRNQPEDSFDSGFLHEIPSSPHSTAHSGGIRGYASKIGLGESWRKDYQSLGPDVCINPLTMNPPTPLGWRSGANSRADSDKGQRPVSVMSASSQNSSPRTKRYGDLSEATRAIRSPAQPAKRMDHGGAEEEKRREMARSKMIRKNSASGGWLSGTTAPNSKQANPYAFETDTNPSTYSDDPSEPSAQGTEKRRVVSRSTGVDLSNSQMVYDDRSQRRFEGYGGLGHGDAYGGGFRSNGQRNVSGKVAEEGQAGYGWTAVAFRRRLAEGWR